MSDEQPEPGSTSAGASALSDKLDGIGWALFLIWLGIAFLVDVGWGWGLLGIGIIILAEAALRRYWALNVGGFWVACGLLFLLGGLWELFQIDLPLVPILLILGGIALLIGTIRGRHLLKK